MFEFNTFCDNDNDDFDFMFASIFESYELTFNTMMNICIFMNHTPSIF